MGWQPLQHSSWMLLEAAQTGWLQLQWNCSCRSTASRTAESLTNCTLIAQKSGCRADDYSLKLDTGLPAQVEKQAREQWKAWEMRLCGFTSLRPLWFQVWHEPLLGGVQCHVGLVKYSHYLLNREKRGNIFFLCQMHYHTAKSDSAQQKWRKPIYI